MTLKVSNASLIRELAAKTWRANRKRNLLTIFAIFLTTLLITVVLGLGITYYQTLSLRQLRSQGMDFDIRFSEPTPEQVEKVRALKQVKSAGVMVKCAIVQACNGTSTDKLQLYWMDETAWEQQCIPALEFCEGHYPSAQNEIMLSTYVLSQLGIEEPKVGMTLSLTYYVLAEGASQEDTYTEDFVLSGYYRDYTSFGRGYVAEPFYRWSGARQTDLTQGYVNIKLKNPLYSTSDLMEIQDELNLGKTQIIEGDTYAIEVFFKTMLVLAALLLMILVSGYLFIYNTLYISIARDIRYYGQLKTLGTTSRQLRTLIYRGMARNSLLGILPGLLAGYGLAGLIVPRILTMVATTVDGQSAPPPLWICLPAAAVAFLTNWIGTRQPARMAGNCSPVEAMRYTGLTGRRKDRTSPHRRNSTRKGSFLSALARREMFRSPRQAAVILLSFITSVSLVLVVCVVIRMNDAKIIQNATLSYDLYVNNLNQIQGIGEITSKKVEQLRQIPGVAQVRTVTNEEIVLPYQEEAFGDYFKSLYGGRYSPGNYEEDLALYKAHPEYGYFAPRMIGLDEAGFSLINQQLGNSLDWESFENGSQAIALCSSIFAEGTDMTNEQFVEQFRQEITGKELHFSTPRGTDPKKEYTVTAAAAMEGGGTYFVSGGSAPSLYVSDRFMEQLFAEPVIERAYVVYEKPYSRETEQLVRDVFAGCDTVSFSSKIDQYEEMRGTENQVKLLGGCLALVIALLAVLNYCNMMTAKVQDRAKEFASLESIGMTRRQTQQMLALEGIGYALLSLSISLLISLPAGYAVFQALNAYHINYFSFPWGGCLVLGLLVLALCAAVPVLLYRASWKGSLVERLQNSE